MQIDLKTNPRLAITPPWLRSRHLTAPLTFKAAPIDDIRCRQPISRGQDRF
jgi:hypothetical protein